VEDNAPVSFLLQSSCGAGAGAGCILAAPADHDAKVALNASLSLDLDGAVLQRCSPGVDSAAGKHTPQASDAALRMSYL